jgi:hypothetical protein
LEGAKVKIRGREQETVSQGQTEIFAVPRLPVMGPSVGIQMDLREGLVRILLLLLLLLLLSQSLLFVRVAIFFLVSDITISVF